jgi:transcriptional accessory protein Tex/SPT6
LSIVAAAGLALASPDIWTASAPIAITHELLIDPNTASAQALALLPHIGPALASRVVAARAERAFTSLDDLRNRVRGLGPVTLTRLAPHLRIAADLRVDPLVRTRVDNLDSRSAGAPARKARAPRRKTPLASRAVQESTARRLVAQPAEQNPPRSFTVADRD